MCTPDTTTPTREQTLERMQATGAYDPDCRACQRYFGESTTHPFYIIAPRHTASPRCESGGHPHCTCDPCF